MITKVGIIVGILAALAAAEGSNRFGSFVSAFGGSDGGFYTMFLIISIVSAGALLAHYFNKKNSILNYALVALNAISVILLLGAPMLGVVIQIFAGMIITIICLLIVQFTYTETSE
jgi:biotin transporter BioY